MATKFQNKVFLLFVQVLNKNIFQLKDSTFIPCYMFLTLALICSQNMQINSFLKLFNLFLSLFLFLSRWVLIWFKLLLNNFCHFSFLFFFSWIIIKCNCIINIIFTRTPWLASCLILFSFICYFFLNIFFTFCLISLSTSNSMANLWNDCLFEHIMQWVLNFTFYFLILLSMYWDDLVNDITIKTLLFIVKLMIKTFSKIIKNSLVEVLHLLKWQ